ncbi:MAG TPA: hypothetical protein ENG85_00195 [Bacteroidetes bacterium]|nr:hypothetical protein [Bacteroidota bacterium]
MARSISIQLRLAALYLMHYGLFQQTLLTGCFRAVKYNFTVFLLYLPKIIGIMKYNISQRWTLLAANGVIAVIFGVLAIFVPGPTLLTVVTYFGIVILLLGAAMLVGGILTLRNGLDYGTDLAEAIVLMIIGVLLTFYTRQSLKIFVIIIGSWAILIGLMQLFIAFKLNPELNGKNTLLINGGLSLVFGIILFFNPFQAAVFVLVLTGILAIAVGTILIIVAMKMKNFFRQREH